MPPALLGVGNPLGRDDGVGPWVACRMAALGWDVYESGPTPENILGKIERDRPHTLVVVDAAKLGLSPGSFRRLPHEAVPAMLSSTHGLPLSFLLSLVRPSVGDLVLIGVQPAALGPGEGLTPEVEAGAASLVKTLASGEIDAIPLHGRTIADVDRRGGAGEHGTRKGP